MRGNMQSLAQKSWLGDLDSNQDSQIQSLESYQLDDLPADGRKKNEPQQIPEDRGSRDSTYLI
jgi:hypothetical protein